MRKQELYIKNMVCPRCETVIRMELEQLGGHVLILRPGYASVTVPDSVNRRLIAQRLRHHGFDLLEDPEERTVEQLKAATLQYRQLQEQAASEGKILPTLSDFLTQTVGKNYAYLSKLFSRHEEKTLEKYYISLRIERVKELLHYGELNVSEIARQLGYSSVHYLSAQFKKVTGQSVSEYRKEEEVERRSYRN